MAARRSSSYEEGGGVSSRQPTWIVTGGAGFIGASFALMARARGLARVVVLDRLRFPSVRASLAPLARDPGFDLIEGSIGEPDTLESLFRVYEPDAVIHCAAETHVDRSIAGPEAFVDTNVMGTLRLLEATRVYLARAPSGKRVRVFPPSTGGQALTLPLRGSLPLPPREEVGRGFEVSDANR